ncbi:MAG: protein TolA [Xanthobacteraceae bacterium]|jgi:outer membrane biosynthesis protein TonB
MKPGMTISCVAHAVALFFGFMAISAQPMEAPPVQALPVSFVSEKDFSQLPLGMKNAPQLKVPDIKPLADKVDETKPVDQMAPKVSAKPEITTPAAKPVSEAKPEPKPDPKPEPKPELKTELKPAPKPADKPDKPKPPEYKPDQIANLLKKDAAKDPPKQQDAPTQPVRDSTPKFDANQVAQLLDKREPQRQVATAQSLNDSPTLGAAIGAQDAQLSQSEIDALRARISNCWSPPPGINANSRLYVVLRVLFKTDGSMVQAPTLVEGSASPLGPALAESAKRALLLCQPFTMLKPEHYDQWKDLELKFDPHELLGG